MLVALTFLECRTNVVENVEQLLLSPTEIIIKNKNIRCYSFAGYAQGNAHYDLISTCGST